MVYEARTPAPVLTVRTELFSFALASLEMRKECDVDP